ncbi:hypothetical protein SAMN04488688_1132 [Paenibacillus sp. cl141a]|nr:hypothetical protein SAMN04488688_1132 [Paenibacillus sp. cl141a]
MALKPSGITPTYEEGRESFFFCAEEVDTNVYETASQETVSNESDIKIGGRFSE